MPLTPDPDAVAAWLGLRATSWLDLHEQIEAGLPPSAYTSLLQELERWAPDVHWDGLLPSLVLNWRGRGLPAPPTAPLARDIGDRLARIARIVATVHLHSDLLPPGPVWLTTPHPELEDGDAPVRWLDTDAGVARVLELLAEDAGEAERSWLAQVLPTLRAARDEVEDAQLRLQGCTVGEPGWPAPLELVKARDALAAAEGAIQHGVRFHVPRSPHRPLAAAMAGAAAPAPPATPAAQEALADVLSSLLLLMGHMRGHPSGVAWHLSKALVHLEVATDVLAGRRPATVPPGATEAADGGARPGRAFGALGGLASPELVDAVLAPLPEEELAAWEGVADAPFPDPEREARAAQPRATWTGGTRPLREDDPAPRPAPPDFAILTGVVPQLGKAADDVQRALAQLGGVTPEGPGWDTHLALLEARDRLRAAVESARRDADALPGLRPPTVAEELLAAARAVDALAARARSDAPFCEQLYAAMEYLDAAAMVLRTRGDWGLADTPRPATADVVEARRDLARSVGCIPAARLPHALRWTRAQVESALTTGALLAVPTDPTRDAWHPSDGLEAAQVPEGSLSHGVVVPDLDVVVGLARRLGVDQWTQLRLLAGHRELGHPDEYRPALERLWNREVVPVLRDLLAADLTKTAS